MVLPLPLAPFEEYMLVDDRPAYPMNFFIRLRFTGQFDRAALDKATAITLSRHPLLTAVAERSGRRWIWQSAPTAPAVYWLDTPPDEALPKLEPLDVRLAPGVRVAACEGSGRTDIIIQAHHACCDGLGIFRFIEDLLIAYAQVRGIASSSALPTVDPHLLPGRGRFGFATGRLLKTLPNLMRGLGGVRRFLMRTPQPLIPHQPQPDENPVASDYPAFLTGRLAKAEWTALRTAARQQGVSTNDLLVRDFFLALRDWRRRRVSNHRDGWLRLTIPVNLRLAADSEMPAANVVSMTFPDRSPEDMEDPRRLLDSIHKQMQRIKKWRLGLIFVLSLGLCRRLPGGLHWRTRTRRCMATAVLTNLGPVLDRCPLASQDGQVVIDDAVLQGIDVLPPLRPFTSAAVAVFVYAGRLHLTLHYDSRVIGESDASELLDGFVARTRQSTAPPQK